MRTLYLHIGCHKTGTTSIQKSLFHNLDLLHENGYAYFNKNTKGNPNKGPNRNSWVNTGKKNRLLAGEKGGAIRSPIKLGRMLAQEEEENVIMSAENFSWIFDAHTLNRFAGVLKRHFDRIKVIVYIRRQDLLVVSHFNQASKNFSPSYSFYGYCNRAIPEYKERLNLYLNYNERIRLWENAFGIENMVVRIFEKAKMHKRNVVTDFFHSIGLPDNISMKSANFSIGIERQKVGFLINKNFQEPNSLVAKIIRSSLDNAISSQKSMPSKRRAKIFYNKFKASNIELNKRYNLCGEHDDIFKQHFNKYPKKHRDLWNESLANSAIDNILKSISPLSSIKVEDLTLAAEVLSSDYPIETARINRIVRHLKVKNKASRHWKVGAAANDSTEEE